MNPCVRSRIIHSEAVNRKTGPGSRRCRVYTMRADRPILVSAVFLAAGLSVLFCYGHSGSGLNAALPISNSGFHLNLTTAGGAAIGGVILTSIGVLCFVWAIFAALGWHWSLLTSRGRAREMPASTRVETPSDAQRDEAHPSSAGHRRIL